MPIEVKAHKNSREEIDITLDSTGAKVIIENSAITAVKLWFVTDGMRGEYKFSEFEFNNLIDVVTRAGAEIDKRQSPIDELDQ